MVQSQTGQIVHETLSQKYPTHKRVGRETQVVEHLPSKREVLSSNPGDVYLVRPWSRLQRIV
jgi:hypothetical protein